MVNQNGFKVGGVFHVVCRRPDGSVRWKDQAHNLVVNAGLDHILNTVIKNGTQVATWYLGIKNSGTPAAADTLASHASWTENTNYAGTRKEFVDGALSSQSVSNSGSVASFAIDTDSQSITGCFLCSVTSGTSGTLFSAADFASAKAADDGDTLEVTYTLSADDDGV